jgi:hypothetical protein
MAKCSWNSFAPITNTSCQLAYSRGKANVPKEDAHQLEIEAMAHLRSYGTVGSIDAGSKES